MSAILYCDLIHINIHKLDVSGGQTTRGSRPALGSILNFNT